MLDRKHFLCPCSLSERNAAVLHQWNKIPPTHLAQLSHSAFYFNETCKYKWVTADGSAALRSAGPSVIVLTGSQSSLHWADPGPVMYADVLMRHMVINTLPAPDTNTPSGECAWKGNQIWSWTRGWILTPSYMDMVTHSCMLLNTHTCTHVHTQKHLHKRKSDCFSFHPCPLFSLSPALFLVGEIYMLFFLRSFHAETVLLCTPLHPSPPTQSLHKHSWQEVEALPWHSRVPSNKSLSIRQPAGLTGPVCLWNCPQFWNVCVCVLVCVCDSVYV